MWYVVWVWGEVVSPQKKSLTKPHPWMSRLGKRLAAAQALSLHTGTRLLRGVLLAGQSVWKGRSQGRTCRLSSCSSRRASSLDRSTSCREARSSPASLPTEIRASSRRASFCSLSSLASFRLERTEGRGGVLGPSSASGAQGCPLAPLGPILAQGSPSAACPHGCPCTDPKALGMERHMRDSRRGLSFQSY